MSEKQYLLLDRFLREKRPSEFHHGDCIGADAQAHWNALVVPVFIIIHPPIDSKKRAFCFNKTSYPDCLIVRQRDPKPYLDRNHDIVDESDFLIVAPKTDQEETRSGTWATYRYAKKVGKPFLLLPR